MEELNGSIKQLKNWNCPRCRQELGELNVWCEYCWVKDKIKIYNPDKYYVKETSIQHLINDTGAKPMTPQEELYVKLFNAYKTNPTLNAMTDLELEAHREDLCKIAFEARVCVDAVDTIKKERKPKKNAQGFERNLNIDETSTNAINIIKTRQARLTKAERIQEGLKKLYETAGAANAEELANKAMSARNMSEQVNRVQDNTKPEPTKEHKPIINPFGKK